MLKFLFWNQNRKDLAELVAEAAKKFRLDIMVFCEHGRNTKKVQRHLKKIETYHFTTGLIGDRFHIYTRFNKRFIGIRKEDERFLILEIDLPARERFLLMILHGPSKSVGWQPADSAIEMTRYVSTLTEIQKEQEIEKTIVLGDFNVSPFEDSMTGARAFNAVMDARIAKNEYRVVQRQNYPFFYNPMWNLYGDLTSGPPATHYYNGSTQCEQFWYMLDQVLVSPNLIELFDNNSLQILDKIGETVLINANGRPNKNKYSDHLPIYFEMRI